MIAIARFDPKVAKRLRARARRQARNALVLVRRLEAQSHAQLIQIVARATGLKTSQVAMVQAARTRKLSARGYKAAKSRRKKLTGRRKKGAQ